MTPRRTIPSAAMNTTRAVSISAMTKIPAPNLPLTMSSRWTGWARSRASVPWLRSLLMPSNPKAMPTSGTRSATKVTVVKPPKFCGAVTNRARNRAGAPDSFGASELSSLERKIIGSAAKPAMTRSRTKNRMLPRWSASSLAAMVRHPPDGARSARRALRDVSARRVSAGAAIGALRDVLAVELEQIRAPPAQVRQREPGGRERRRDGRGDVGGAGHDPQPLLLGVRGDVRDARDLADDGVDGGRRAVDGHLQLDDAVRAAGELVEGTGRHEAPGGEEPHPVAQGLDLAQDVRREQDGELALGDEPAKQREELLDARRVDRDRGLVEDEDRRLL